MSERKVVSRNIAIALGVICVILVACLVWTLSYYTSIINEKDRRISELESVITWLSNTLRNLEDRMHNLTSQVNNLQNRVNELNSIANLEKVEVIVNRETVNQPAGGYTSWRFGVGYAGYIVVRVHSSTTHNTYVRVIWSSHGVNYDNIIYVGTSGEAVFPVLPAYIEVRVGNTNLFGGATETVTITYHY
jgi:uncharacterized coiled-coil protein SlyX